MTPSIEEIRAAVAAYIKYALPEGHQLGAVSFIAEVDGTYYRVLIEKDDLSDD